MSRLRGMTISERSAHLIELAVLDERDRIIDLLKHRVCFDHIATGNCDHSACWATRDIIALIKGENE